MASLISAVAHGMIADQAFRFANLVPDNTGIDENTTYYVLAAGLTVDAFRFSDAIAGTAFVMTANITDGSIIDPDSYVVNNDGIETPPDAPSAVVSVTLSSAASIAPDGTVVTRLDITLSPSVATTLLNTVVTITGGSNAVKVVIPKGQTTGSVASVVPGISYTGTAIAYDAYGQASGATASVAHVAAGDTTAPGNPVPASYGGILSVSALWPAIAAADLSHYEAQVDTSVLFNVAPVTVLTKSTFVTFAPLGVGTYWVRVRAIDLSGNASAYGYVGGGVSRLTDFVTNTTAKVTIDAAGLTIQDGALFIKDEFGSSVLGASGFSGSWTDYIRLGLYNASFADGVVGAITMGRTVKLPYWTLAQTTGSPTATYVDSAGSNYVEIGFAALNNKLTMTSDPVPVQENIFYVVPSILSFVVAGGVPLLTVTPKVAWYNSLGALISTSTFDASAASTTTAAFAFNASPLLAPATAKTAQLIITIEELLAHNAGNKVRLWAEGLTAAPPENLSTMDLQVDTLSANFDIDAGSLVVGGLMTIGGSSFPASPSTGNTYYRTDKGEWYFYDGTRWLTATLYTLRLSNHNFTAPMTLAATTAAVRRETSPTQNGGSDIYLVEYQMTAFVTGGTALSASHKWVVTLDKVTVANVNTTVGTLTVQAGTLANWLRFTTNINAVLGTTATFPLLAETATKTGTPGTFQYFSELTFRRVAT